MTVKLAFNTIPQFHIQQNGALVPATGAKLFTYLTGTTTKQSTFQDSAGSTPHANPIILNSRGEPANGSGSATGIWLTFGVTYKFVLAPATDTDPPASPYWTVDGIAGINDSSIIASEWIASGLTPTYINGTQFSVAGDQQNLFEIGHRLRVSLTAGTKYCRVTNVSYAAITTVTVSAMDGGGTLDSGLASVDVGILDAANSSIPYINFPSVGNITVNAKVTHTETTTQQAAHNLAAEVSVATAATCPIGAAASNNILLTGTTSITAFDNVAAGITRWCRIQGTFTLTYNATSLIIPGGSNINTFPGDTFEAESLGSGNWVVRAYQRMSSVVQFFERQYFPTF